ncbi:MAG: flagella basal body P-ring formation protein FlgA [Campylobacterales bacterium]|nr:flagella basal body P-ring formation protein FlgA [Campylobacterales bacterium]
MIKSLFLSLILWLSILNGSELHSNYYFDTPLILSKNIDPTCEKNFEVLRIPDGKMSYRVNAQILLKTFELGGCPIETNKVRFVNFTKEVAHGLTLLEQQLKEFFKHTYPTIEIQEVHIFPRGSNDVLPKEIHPIFDNNSYKANRGTFYLLDDNGVRRYFDFTIDATLSALYTTQKVTHKETLSTQNTLLKPLPFTTFRAKPLDSLPDTPYRFRASLQENVPILDRQIEPLPMVLRGSKVSVIIQNGAVIVEFIATATQEGKLYDIITVEKGDGKRSRAKIIGENKVELQ